MSDNNVDIDALLEQINLNSSENAAQNRGNNAMEKEAVDLAMGNTQSIDSAKLRSIMEDETYEEKKKKKNIFGSLKKSLSGIAVSVKEKSSKFLSDENRDEEIDDFDDEEERFYLDDEEKELDDDILIVNSDSDEEAEEFSEIEIVEENEYIPDEKTRVIELDDNFEEETDDDIKIYDAPVSEEDIEEEQAIETEKNRSEFNRRMQEDNMEGQMMFSGFNETNVEPETISEEEAERELFLKRKEKISSFALLNDDDSDNEIKDDSEKIGELFISQSERPRRKISEEENFAGIEYSQTKDARRVLRFLKLQRKKSFKKLVGLAILALLILIISVGASIRTTVGGDRILTIFINFVSITAALMISNQTIINSFERLKKKKININSAISLSAILCFIQTLLMMVLYFLEKNTVSVFAGMGIGLLLISEINNYIMYGRTIDAMEMCTGDNRDKLYSVEGIADDKDAVELAKIIRRSAPRIRYSCKTRFPAHLVELCMGECSVDKVTKTTLPVIVFLSVINLVVAWLTRGDFATGFAAFVLTMALSVPAYGALLIQLPLRWVNKRFNKVGGMISGQSAVDELFRTNIIMLDSRDLFDRDSCSMIGFKDFKNVRMDDAMLYAAAMAVRSGGPLTDVFDKMVSGRRDVLPAVKSFSYEEKLGISGWINGQKVVMGNKAMMLAHNILMTGVIDEDKYLLNGHEVIYLAIAHQLAAMMVVDYAPDVTLKPYLKKMRDSGVGILVRNCDPNVTEEMISACYDMRLDNIKILNTSSGRIFRKYKSRPKLATKASSIHDGTPYTFMKSLCVSANLKKVFRVANMLSLIGMLMSFVIVLLLSILNVVSDLPVAFGMFIQIVMTLGFTGIIKLLSTK